jgi:PAS domain S-box-containing protein
MAKKLQQTEELYYAVIQQMADAIILFDVETKRILDSNAAFRKLLGYTPEELKALTIYDYVAHERENIDLHIGLVLTQRQHYHGERQYRRKDGSLVDVEVSAKLVTYGGRKVICAVTRDVSERKEAERALRESEQKLRLLSSHLLTAQETERRRISIELHDELGQALMVLKLHLKSMERKLQKNQVGLKEECEHTLQYINQIIDKVRRISRDLSPSILEDLGLTAALRWLIDDFTSHSNNIESSVDIPELNDLFSPDAKIIIYRIFQEAFTNIGKCADATHLSVVIKKQGDSVSFFIGDNGKGFDMERVLSKDVTERGLGLTAMDERVRMLGGSLDLWSRRGKGTRISFAIPINQEGA